MKRNKQRFLTCPWCKKRMVAKTLTSYGQEVLQCNNCGSWCGSIFVYLRKRIQHFFD